MAEGASPLDLVVRILNNQLTSLLWIDEKVSCLLNIHGMKFWICYEMLLNKFVFHAKLTPLVDAIQAGELSGRIQTFADQGALDKGHRGSRLRGAWLNNVLTFFSPNLLTVPVMSLFLELVAFSSDGLNISKTIAALYTVIDLKLGGAQAHIICN